MCGDCFVCIYLVCQCDGLELGRRNRRITVRGVAVRINIPTSAFTYGAKSQKRLTVACDLVRFYQTVGRDLTAANIQRNQVMSNFEIQWKALKDRKDEVDPDVPKITKALPIIKWTEAFQDFLHRVIGARMIPLTYVI